MAAPFLKMNRVSTLALLLAASAVLSGCVYVRLARVKHQLAEVEKNVALDIRDGLWLSFAEPILLPEDILRIARREPSRVELSFNFDHPGGRLLRVQARFAGITLDLAYPLAARSKASS